MAVRPFTDDDRARLSGLHAEGLSLTAIAREMGRSKETIGRYAAELGLSFDRAATAAATAAHVIDAKARRTQLALNLLADAERLREQIWQPHQYIDHGGRDFLEARWTQPEPSPVDKLKLIQAAAVAVDRSLKLDEYDSGNAAQAGSLLGSLFKSLQDKHGTGDDPPVDE